MGIFKFRRSKKILPGVKLNIGKKGPTSLSFGRRGATMNVSSKGTKTTVGIPGTGLSYSTKSLGSTKKTKNSSKRNSSVGGIFLLLVILFVLFHLFR